MQNRNLLHDPELELKETFTSVEAAIEGVAEHVGCQGLIKLSGTTATVCLILHGKLYMAHVGDSRALYCSLAVSPCGLSSTLPSETGSEDEIESVVVNVTDDHSPNRSDEKTRIESKGGVVRQIMRNLPFRIFEKNSHKPGLAMSRALGDFAAQRLGVLHEPDIKVVDISGSGPQTRDFLIVASDGVWEVLGNDEILNEVKLNFAKGEKMIAENIASKAAKRWEEIDRMMTDDITILVHRIK